MNCSECNKQKQLMSGLIDGISAASAVFVIGIVLLAALLPDHTGSPAWLKWVKMAVLVSPLPVLPIYAGYIRSVESNLFGAIKRLAFKIDCQQEQLFILSGKLNELLAAVEKLKEHEFDSKNN